MWAFFCIHSPDRSARARARHPNRVPPVCATPALFRSYQIFVSLLKLDLWFGIVGTVTVGLFLFVDYELVIDCVAMVITLGWAALGWASARRESSSGFALFFVFMPVEPAYVLAKVLLNTRRRPENVLVSELYETIVAKEIPIAEWPNFVMMSMSGGEPLSAWL